MKNISYPVAMATNDTPISAERVAFGLRLKAAREAAGYTQKDIGDRYELNKATVSAWETGRGDPGVFRLVSLAALYKVSAADLMGSTDANWPFPLILPSQYQQLDKDFRRGVENSVYGEWMQAQQAKGFGT